MTSLTDLREGLHTSVSQVKCYLKCPEKYRLQYVVGAEPEFRPANLVLGSAVHEGLAAHYRSVMQTSESPEMDVCMAAFNATLAEAKKNATPIEDRGDDLETIGTGLLKAFYEATYQDPPLVVAVEQPFAVEIHDPSTGEVLEERLVGALDLVVKAGGRNIVIEHKTAARKWSADQVKHDIQLSAYRMVARVLGLGEAGMRVQALTKTKKPAFVVDETERNDQDINDFLTTTVGVLRAVDAGAFFPVRTGMCGGCPFRRRCEGK